MALTKIISSMVSFVQTGAGAILRTVSERLSETVHVSDYMTTAQRVDVAARTALVDTTAAYAAAVARAVAIGGKRVVVPAGVSLLLGGAASPDGYKNGVLLPGTGADFTTANGITLVGEGTGSVLRAGSANMIVLRHSRVHSGAANIKIDGAGLANVIGRYIGPEDATQTTLLVSQSHASYSGVSIENCTEGTIMQPGPTVAGADSGNFYHHFHADNFNNNTRDLWLKKDITGNGNRVTRSAWYNPVFTRGNTGVWIDGGTELDFYSPNFEMKNSGVSPSAIPTAFNYNDTNPSSIRIFGGYAEACTKAVKALSPEHVTLFGFAHTAAKDASEFSMGRFQLGRLTVPKLLNTAAYMNIGGEGFVGFIADPDQTGVKTLALQLNGAEKERWANTGAKTFFGSSGNITYNAAGTTVAFTFNGGNTIDALGAAASLSYRTNFHSWQTGAGSEIMTLSAVEFLPRQNNTTSFGLPGGYLWKSVAATNVSLFPPASVTPTTNGELTFQLTSNTSLAVKVRGSDGVVRSAVLALA